MDKKRRRRPASWSQDASRRSLDETDPPERLFLYSIFPDAMRSGIFYSFAGSFQGNATAELSPAPIEIVQFSGV